MDKRLKEIAFGEWEGKSVARNQMEVPDEFLKFYDDPEHFAGAPGGESFAEVKERTDDFLKWLVGEYKSRDIVPLMQRMFTFIAEFEGDIPGAAARDCGNYLDQNLGMAKYLAKKYLAEVLNDITDERLIYPE